MNIDQGPGLSNVPSRQTVQRRTALVTGASSGIGEAFAHVFAGNGFDVVLVARREARLRAVATDIERTHGVRAHTVVMDLARRDAVATLMADLSARALTIDALVNNAGYGVPGLLNAVSWQVHADSLQVMVTGVVELTYRLWPGMVERGYGRVINVASLAGLVPAPAGHPLYGASKAFLIKFSESMANEGRRHGVHVTALCPGFTLSEFHDVTGTREQMRSLPKWMWLDAARVAREGYDAVMAGTPIYINGGVNRAVALGIRYAPQWLVHAVGQRMAKSYRKT